MSNRNTLAPLEAELRKAVLTCAAVAPAAIDFAPQRDAPGLAHCRQPCWRDLRQTVVAFAAAMHEQGDPPEVALREVKAVMRSAGPSIESSSAMMTAAVAWCIEGYYGEPPRTG